MHLECHATLGWILANALTGNRRERNYVVVASVLPDIDALPYLFGPYYYGLYHHTFGHNIFLGFALALYGWRKFGWRTGIVAGISFAGHIVTDAYLSNWMLYLFWPFSRRGFLPAGSVELSAPINTWLLYSTPVFLLLVGLIWKRTPLEWIHPILDLLFLSAFRKKPARCSICARGANLHCDRCSRPICPRHCTLQKQWQTCCPDCQ